MKDELYKHFKLAVGIIVILGVFVFGMIWGVTRPANFSAFDFSETGSIGDTIGGISAPIIGVFGVTLTFLAFYIQFLANEKHSQQFKQQYSEGVKNQATETIKWLIEKNRAIVDSIHIGNIKGVKCLSKLCVEFRCIYETAKYVFTDELSDEEITNISYVVFQNGIGPLSNRLNYDLFGNVRSFQKLIFLLEDLKRIEFDETRSLFKDDDLLREMKGLGYVPFEGHHTRLGHYFRNLFHVLTIVDDEKLNYFSDDDRYQIVKYLRTQMSSYEQILIYLNSMSVYGKPMKDNGFIEKYKLIKNIPFPLISYIGDIKKQYPNIVFEWEESKSRIVVS